MFDLVTGAVDRPFHERSVRSTIVSLAGHVIVLLAVAGMSVLSITQNLPRIPPMMAFAVAAPPSVPALPPPPAAPRVDPRASMSAPRSPTPGVVMAPVDAPMERPSENGIEAEGAFGVSDSMAGGVADGMVGGAADGIVGGVLPVETPPPLAPPAPQAPVRIGGLITAPKLLVQVQPIYPPLAVAAQVTGTVILDATVGTDGCVESIRVLRANPLLAKAAVEAVKQWRYSPIMLNGIPTPFILTVTVGFSIKN